MTTIRRAPLTVALPLLVILLLEMFLVATLSVGARPSSAQVVSWANRYGKSPTQFTPADWAPIVDAQWANVLTDSEKLALFDNWLNNLDTRYGGHHNSDVNLDTLRSKYRPEVEAGNISRGRFAGIMTHLTYQLEELHTYLFDTPVRNTPTVKGVPMMIIGQWDRNRKFGALLTPLPDSTLLVYEALAGHPIGLERGDLVLGYDGVLWKDIYPKLIAAELPIFYNVVNGSTPESNYYYAMQAAGLNWHLFDTIDIVKYDSGDTLHFSTNLLSSNNRDIWGKEQIPPPGVPWPNRSAASRIGWGIIRNTNIGMVTVTSWSFDAQFDIRARFEQAVDELMHVHEADGIIFDFRFNTGGGALAREGLQLLFNTVVPTVGFDQRVPGSEDVLAMEPDPQRFEANLVIRGDTNTYYDKPIAILIGPGSISAGELEARRMSFHPRARVFGLPAPGGNTGSDFISIGDADWFVSRSHSAQYLVSTHEYLTHKGMQPDVRVWFDRDDVANNVDTVIKTAMEWIESGGPVDVDGGVDERQHFNAVSYPNPFRQKVTIEYDVPSAAVVDVTIYDLLGRQVASLHSGRQPAGLQKLQWDGRDTAGRTTASGIYLWKIGSNDGIESGMFVMVR